MGHAQDCGRAGIGAVLVLAAWSPARSAAPRSVFRGFLKLFVRPHSVSVYSPLGCLEPLISRPGAHGSLSSAEGIAGGLPSPGASGGAELAQGAGGTVLGAAGSELFPKSRRGFAATRGHLLDSERRSTGGWGKPECRGFIKTRSASWGQFSAESKLCVSLG